MAAVAFLPQHERSAQPARKIAPQLYTPHYADLSPQGWVQHLARRDFSALLPTCRSNPIGPGDAYAAALELARTYRQNADPRAVFQWNELLDSQLDPTQLPALEPMAAMRRLGQWVVSLQLLLHAGAARYLAPQVVQQLLQGIGLETRRLLDEPAAEATLRLPQLLGVIRVAIAFPEYAEARSWLARAIAQLDSTLALLLDEEGAPLDPALTPVAQFELLCPVLHALRLLRLGSVVVPASLPQRLVAALACIAWSLPDPAAILQDAAALLDGPGQPWPGEETLRWIISRGATGRAPTRASRRYTLSERCFLRDGWRSATTSSPAPAQHVSIQTGHGLLGLGYHLDQQPVLLAPAGPQDSVRIDGLLPGAQPASHLLHELGLRSDWLRAQRRHQPQGPLHTRCVVYMMRQYLLVIDRFQADDDQEHQLSLPLQFGVDWDDSRCQQAASDRALVHGPGWVAAMLSPDPALPISLGHRDGRPRLQAEGRWRHSAVLATVVGPEGATLRLRSCELQRTGQYEERLVIRGQDALGRWTDTCIFRNDSRQRVLCPDYELYSDLLAERRDASGELVHAVAAGPGDVRWHHALPLRITPHGHLEC
ncbi:MAG: Heparinase N-terminus [Pseudomonadota bacterium]